VGVDGEYGRVVTSSMREGLAQICPEGVGAYAKVLPAALVGPLRLAQIAATRRCDVYKSVIGRDQAVAVNEALKSITANATH
jgi:hypothetical protein